MGREKLDELLRKYIPKELIELTLKLIDAVIAIEVAKARIETVVETKNECKKQFSGLPSLFIFALCFLLAGCTTYTRQWHIQDRAKFNEDYRRCYALAVGYRSTGLGDDMLESCLLQAGHTIDVVEQN